MSVVMELIYYKSIQYPSVRLCEQRHIMAQKQGFRLLVLATYANTAGHCAVV